MELDEVKLAEGLKDGSQVLFGDVEVDVPNVETVIRNLVWVTTTRFGSTRLTILLSLGDLDDDRNSFEFLTSELQGLSDGFFILELNITDTRELVSSGLTT